MTFSLRVRLCTSQEGSGCRQGREHIPHNRHMMWTSAVCFVMTQTPGQNKAALSLYARNERMLTRFYCLSSPWLVVAGVREPTLSEQSWSTSVDIPSAGALNKNHRAHLVIRPSSWFPWPAPASKVSSWALLESGKAVSFFHHVQPIHSSHPSLHLSADQVGCLWTIFVPVEPAV